MKIVVIGNGPAAIKAVEAFEYHRSVSREKSLEVTLISSEKESAYAPMFLIKYITGQLTENQMLLGKASDRYSFPIRKIFGKKATRVEEEKKTVLLEDGQEIVFDKLLIANGAAPIVPPIKGLGKKGVFYLGRKEDAKKISHALGQASDIVVIGAGAMGMEAAIALSRMGRKVRVVEMTPHILPQALAPHLATYAQERLVAEGIEFRLGETVSEMIGNESVTGVVTKGGKEIRGNLALITAGVRPNTDFLESTSIEARNGIIVDDMMETSVPDVYAAGDVAESRNPSGAYELVFNWYSAIAQGWTAGSNIMGARKKYRFRPLLSALKEVRFPVISIGRRVADGCERLSHRDEKREVLEDIYIKDDVVECYQAVGAREKAGLMYSLIMNRKGVGKLKDDLFLKGFNATRLIP